MSPARLLAALTAAVAITGAARAAPVQEASIANAKPRTDAAVNVKLRRELRAERAHGDRLRRVLAGSRDRGRRLARVLRHEPSVAEGIGLASTVYGVPEGQLTRLVACESGGRSDATNASSGAAGASQFLPSTFASTPFARFSIYSPTANLLAAGWLWRKDGGSFRQWECAP